MLDWFATCQESIYSTSIWQHSWRYLRVSSCIGMSPGFQALSCTAVTFSMLNISSLTVSILQGSDWDIFIQLLCVSMELAIMNILSNSSVSSVVGLGHLNCGSSSSFVLLRCRLKKGNWSVVAGTIRVLRNILKYLKQEHEDELVEVYLESISSSLSKIPWCQLDKFFDPSIDTNEGSRLDASNLRCISVEERKIIFLGNLLQFLSSLVELSNFSEASGTLQSKHPIIVKVINLIPRLLSWCLGKDENSVNHCMTLYFRHKLLVWISFLFFLFMCL